MTGESLFLKILAAFLAVTLLPLLLVGVLVINDIKEMGDAMAVETKSVSASMDDIYKDTKTKTEDLAKVMRDDTLTQITKMRDITGDEMRRVGEIASKGGSVNESIEAADKIIRDKMVVVDHDINRHVNDMLESVNVMVYMTHEKVAATTAAFEDNIDALMRKTADELLAALVLITAVVFGLAVFFTRRIIKPIYALTQSAKTMSEGNFDCVVEVNTRDEIGQLADAFNQMGKSLKEWAYKLKESEERYRNLVENVPDIIYSLNDKEEFISINSALTDLLGYSKEEIIGTNFSKIIHREDADKVIGSFREIAAGERKMLKGLEFKLLTKKGEAKCFEFNVRGVYDADGKLIRTEGIARDITERRQAEEELLGKFLRYKVRKGEVYLIKEKSPDLSLEVFKDMLSCGFSGTVFSRMKSEEIEEIFGKVKSFWFAGNSMAKDAIEPRFSEIESHIKDLGAGNNAVLIDRLDYLISKNGFDATLEFVQRLFEHAYCQKLIVLLVIDPQTLESAELLRLEKETKRVEPKVKSGLPEDLYEILKFVHSENRIGEYPSYKDVHEKFNITRTTARSRINKLKSMKFLVDRKRGRTKLLEVTTEGREQF